MMKPISATAWHVLFNDEVCKPRRQENLIAENECHLCRHLTRTDRMLLVSVTFHANMSSGRNRFYLRKREETSKNILELIFLSKTCLSLFCKLFYRTWDIVPCRTSNGNDKLSYPSSSNQDVVETPRRQHRAVVFLPLSDGRPARGGMVVTDAPTAIWLRSDSS